MTWYNSGTIEINSELIINGSAKIASHIYGNDGVESERPYW